MKVFVGSDHRGVDYKAKVCGVLNDLGVTVIDVGSFDSTESCDYPKVAYDVGTQVAETADARGVLLCMSGIGMSIAANKVHGCLAALCYNAEAATLCRQHNNANILVLSSKFVAEEDLKDVIKNFMETEFEGGRHQRRVDQIKDIEKGVKLT
ncbi:MAG: ribose 5-phosphate isomerase B [Lysobacterales bacterium]|jgi:ribose 5-phosphate isomerase B